MKNTLLQIKQFNVLYIEDDSQTATTVLSLYRSIFKKVYYCNNAQEGLKLFKEDYSTIDLIVVEAQMPNFSGMQMISQIKKDKNCKHPIIFTINQSNDDTILKCLKLGATDYLIKPFQHNTHLGILLKVLQPIFDTKKVHNLNQQLEIYKRYADKQLLISKTDLEGVINYANDNFCKVSQYNQEELIGSPHNIVRHPMVPKRTYKNMWETITVGDIWSGKVQNRAKDGSSYFVEADIFPIKDDNDTIIEYISFRQDVTEHVLLNKKTRDVLKETKLNYSKIYEDSIGKAKIKVAKEFNNLEFSLNLERENSLKQTRKRALAEKKLNDTTEEKDKEIKKWKIRISLAGKTIDNLNNVNKKLITDSRKYTDVIDSNKQKSNIAQVKLVEVKKDNTRLEKLLRNKDEVIKHLEEELQKYKISS